MWWFTCHSVILNTNYVISIIVYDRETAIYSDTNKYNKLLITE